MDDRGEQLARLIEESPEDEDAFRVYTDWLEERGDPRATLVRLQMTRERVTDRAKLDHLETRLAELFEQHREHFLGPLAKVLPSSKSSRAARDNAPKLEWRRGFVYKAELRRLARMPMHRFLDHLISHPSGRFLVELRDLWAEDPEALIEVLATRAPRTLRRLQVSGTDGTRMVSLASLWPRLDRLEEIEVGAAGGLGYIELPKLRRATFSIYDPAHLASLAAARWPALEHLSLHVPTTTEAAQLVAVFENELPALRSLELGFYAHAPELLSRLSKLPIGRQLRELTLYSTPDILDALMRCTFDLDVLRFDDVLPDADTRFAHIARRVERS